MTTRDRIGALLGGGLAGIAGGLFGVGGGLVLVPVLTGFFRLTQHQAHGTSLAIISATAITGIIIYGAYANVVWPIAALAAIGSLCTAHLGARLAARWSPRRLRRAFALFLALVALRLLWQVPIVGTHAALEGLAGLGVSLLLGLVAGYLSGLMGVGGGIIVVPVLTLVFGLSQQAAQGTSLAIMVVTAPRASLEHARLGNVVWPIVPMMAVGAALGAPLASWSAQGLPHDALVRGFALFLLATSIHTWMRAAARS